MGRCVTDRQFGWYSLSSGWDSLSIQASGLVQLVLPVGQPVTTRQCGLEQLVLRMGQPVTTRQCGLEQPVTTRQGGLVQPVLRVGQSALSILSMCTFTLYLVQSVLYILRLLLALNIINVRSVDLRRLIDSQPTASSAVSHSVIYPRATILFP